MQTVLSELYPTTEELYLYHDEYAKNKTLDTPHSSMLLAEIRRKCDFWYWRVIDRKSGDASHVRDFWIK